MTDELNVLAGAYALDALNDDELNVFEEHLQSCADCSEEVLGMQNAAAELSHLEAVAPPAQLRSDVLSAITRVRPLPPIRSNVISLDRPRRTRWATSLVAAACVLFAIIGVGWGYQQHRQADSARTKASALNSIITAPDARTVSASLNNGSKETAQIYYSKTKGALVMSAHGFAELSADRTYQAWLITPDNRSTSLGTFKPDTKGDVTMQGHASLADAAYVGVTVEPAGGSKFPTGRPALVKL